MTDAPQPELSPCLSEGELTELERLLAKTTKAPWSVEDLLGSDILSVIANGAGPVYDWRHIAQLSTEPSEDKGDPSPVEQEANAKLIAAMRNALPTLLAMARRSDLCETLLKRLANAADTVGVEFFDTDTMAPSVTAMQLATQDARAFLKGRRAEEKANG